MWPDEKVTGSLSGSYPDFSSDPLSSGDEGGSGSDGSSSSPGSEFGGVWWPSVEGVFSTSKTVVKGADSTTFPSDLTATALPVNS